MKSTLPKPIAQPKQHRPNPDFVIADDLFHAVYQNGTLEHSTSNGEYCEISYIPRENDKGNEINPHFLVAISSLDGYLFTTWRQVEKFIRGQLSSKELANHAC